MQQKTVNDAVTCYFEGVNFGIDVLWKSNAILNENEDDLSGMIFKSFFPSTTGHAKLIDEFHRNKNLLCWKSARYANMKFKDKERILFHIQEIPVSRRMEINLWVRMDYRVLVQHVTRMCFTCIYESLWLGYRDLSRLQTARDLCSLFQINL